MACTLEAVEGDITDQPIDAIVNAANSSLLGGGGVDGAIHHAGGPDILAECRAIRADRLPDGLPTGDAVATTAGRLPSRWVIHTVGPNRNAGQTDPALLASCFTLSLDVACEIGARSVAFPAISAGIYGWAIDDVARVAVTSVRGHPASTDGTIDLIRFVLFSTAAHSAFIRALSLV
ncbi:MAG TPA: O-acetyl-ADP-ribose deacetylase [Dermatophilaceae bacterium]|nr:O-acetyl-ADP-ribose deacetylase [Dermatophilaceae bacterium]